MSEFKRKCEMKIKDVKAKYKDDLECKDKIISEIRGELEDTRKEHGADTHDLKEAVSFL